MARVEHAAGATTVTIALPAGALSVTAAPPVMISQRNVEAACGIPPRAFLQILRAPGCPLRPTCLGKLRLVRLADLLTWLETMAAPPRTSVAAVNDADNRTGVLAELGLEPAPAPARRRGGRP